jgi:serine/threonine protein kinase
MQNKEQKNKPNDKTMVSEVGASLPEKAKIQSDLASGNVKPSKLSTSQQKALTQIDSGFQTSDTEQGFAAAKMNADKALADNKIILNNRFVLKEALGAGGMGTVYKAQDLRKVEARDTNPYVAAKILNSDFKNHPDAFISLQREASRSHRLSHPNIVTVHDFDRDGNTIFMTMELLQGEDLESLIAKHKNKGLPKEQALTIFKDYCVALDFAHKKGIIHCDFKPGNIFVTKDEGTKVLDFGIARLALESKTIDHFDAGRIGAITPAYASLEMIGHKTPDPRDDVFAAALIAYEMLTGKHPFNSISAATALAKGLKPEKIDRLSKRQWKALSKGLELRRENRSANIKELMDGLTLKPQLPVYRTISLVLILLVGWFSYNLIYSSNELSRVIDDTLAKATQCFQTEDYQCAMESVAAILEISPEHHQAIELGEQAKINQLIQSVRLCINDTQATNCANQEFVELTNLIPKSLILKKLNQEITEKHLQLEIQSNLAIASQCFEMGDFECAIEQAKKTIALDASLEQAMQLEKDAFYALQQQQLKQQSDDKTYQQALRLAQQCFDKKQYDCAIKYANSALQVKPQDIKADELSKNATFARRQYQESLTRANKVLKDGYACLKKLDFSCAIAKSESALEFVPGHIKALQLKKDATESLNQVKKKIEIE